MASPTKQEDRDLLQNESQQDNNNESDDSDIELEELTNDIDADLLTSTRRGQLKKKRYATEASDRYWPWILAWRLRKRTLVLLVVIALLIVVGGLFGWGKYTQTPPDGQSPPWYPSPKGGTVSQWAASYEKASKMVRKMTLAEKVNITTGTGWAMGLAVGNTGPAIHAGFPSLALQDGPLGIRFADNATAFPAGITVGATWNKQLMYQRGQAHGKEAREKGINVLLGPAVGPIGRTPAGGRNWEGFGADPYLQGIAAAETIRGIQGEGVMATIKHFIANEQEHFRQPWAWGLPHAISSNLDDRTLHELYAWPFANAVKAGVASVMCSYNMVNNSYACGNSKMLNGILKDELGFQGFVMSDWLAQQSGMGSALAGLDMSMPGDGLGWVDGKSLWGPHLSRAVLNGSLPVSRLDDMAVRIVASWYQLGQDDTSRFDGKGPNFSSWTNDKMGYINHGSSSAQPKVEVNKYINVQHNHSIVAREIAIEGTVLLKNTGILPLSRSGHHSERKRGNKTRIGIFGDDAGPGLGPNHCEDRGCNQGTLGSGWGSGAVEFPYLVTPEAALKEGFNSDAVNVSSSLTNGRPSNTLLQNMDICVVFVNSDSGEGYLKWGSVAGDRNDLLLQNGGDDLVVAVADGCHGGHGKTIAVVHAVGPVILERWIDHPGIGAVLAANLPGEESGNAIAAIIFGDVSPSGKLPYTIGRNLEDYGSGTKIMYTPNGLVPQQDFNEGVYIDYRHFDRFNIEPRFEFGFGLSYTTFNYSNLQVAEVKPKSKLAGAGERPEDTATPPSFDDKIPDISEAIFPAEIRKLQKYIYPYITSAAEIKPGDYPYPDGYNVQRPRSAAGGGEGGHPELWETHVFVTADIGNEGNVAGKAVPQLYVSFPHVQGVDFPVRVLRGFDKVYLTPGQSRSVQFNLTRRDLSYWDTNLQNWVMPDGEFSVSIGASSRDMHLTGKW